MSENNKAEKDYWQSVRPEGADKITLGDYYSHVLRHDTRFLLFSLARYKFAAKMIGQEPRYSVLELGCNEGIGTLLLSENASHVTGVDFDGGSIKWALANLENDRVHFKEDNFLGKKYGDFDAVVSLDVIEHILPGNQDLYLQTILANLAEDGFCIIGTPNVTASSHASKESAEGHVCLYGAQDLKAFFLKGFKNVFVFGMNDEVVHTGFAAMCHYLFVLACNKR
ncbi:MAG: Ubiquinone biosynthesis O-methyltransferase, mitochondrial [Syntrophus sp. SKADARSKE-3]|nr:Ubiquinone biosynthesis O-methyltransferase, mitochondrial [Syntrophus sp. SKADARSKE-3]